MAGGGDDDQEITGINVTPLVDIALVLLIIFMLTASYIVTPAIPVDLPKAASAENVAPSTLALVLTKNGVLFLNNRPVSDDDVREYIRVEKSSHPDLQAVIAADASIAHGRVVGLIDLVRSEGVTKFALSTDADFKAESPAADGQKEGVEGK